MVIERFGVDSGVLTLGGLFTSPFVSMAWAFTWLFWSMSDEMRGIRNARVRSNGVEVRRCGI